MGIFTQIVNVTTNVNSSKHTQSQTENKKEKTEKRLSIQNTIRSPGDQQVK